MNTEDTGSEDEMFFECKDNENSDNKVKPSETVPISNQTSETKDIECKAQEENTETASLNDENETQETSPDLNEADDITKSLEKTYLDDDVEESLTENEKKEYKADSTMLKNDGNEEFKQQNYKEARNLYTRGLQKCPKCFANERAVLFANRGACYIKMDKKENAISDCSEALNLNPNYMKALVRRAQLYESTEKLEEALTDYKQIAEKDRTNKQAIEACMRLPQQINERNEKLKTEMMEKLKDLGNVVLRPFGLSTNNFQMQQNPDTGSYNIQFVQNPQPPQ